jgi:hypothetical protein
MRARFCALLIQARTHAAFSVIRKAWLFARAIVSASAANGGWYSPSEPRTMAINARREFGPHHSTPTSKN